MSTGIPPTRLLFFKCLEMRTELFSPQKDLITQLCSKAINGLSLESLTLSDGFNTCTVAHIAILFHAEQNWKRNCGQKMAGMVKTIGSEPLQFFITINR